MSNIDKQILGLNPEEDYSKVELRKTYHKLAKKYHPDKYLTSHEKKSAHEMFQVISSAYSRLSGEKVDTNINMMPSLHEIISPQGLFGAFEKAKKFLDENVQDAFVLNGSLSKESPDYFIMSLLNNPDEKYSFDNLMTESEEEEDEKEEKEEQEEQEENNVISEIIGSNKDEDTLTLTEIDNDVEENIYHGGKKSKKEKKSRKEKKHKRRKHKKAKKRSRKMSNSS